MIILLTIFLEKKYTQEEIDAAYALLALSNSAPDPSAGNRAALPKLEAELYVTMDEPPMAPQNTSIEHHLKSVQHSMDSQVSPLTKLNSFVATTLPVREGHYVYSHYVSQPVSSWFYFIENFIDQSMNKGHLFQKCNKLANFCCETFGK